MLTIIQNNSFKKNASFLKFNFSCFVMLIALLSLPDLATAQSNGEIVVIKSRYPSKNFIKLQNNLVRGGDIAANIKSGQWVYEDVPNSPYFRLRKAGTEKQYLNAVNGKLVCKFVPPHAQSSHWRKTKTDKYGYYRIQNRYNKTVYINSKGGALQASAVSADSYSSHWTLKTKDKQGRKYGFDAPSNQAKPEPRPRTEAVKKSNPKPLYEPKPEELKPAPLPNSTWVDKNHDKVLTSFHPIQSKRIQFSLDVNQNITWWKGIKVFHSDGRLLCMLSTQDKQGKDSSIEFTPSQIGKQVKIEYWKAKAFGAHTHVGTEYLNVADIEGYEVAFKWMND